MNFEYDAVLYSNSADSYSELNMHISALLILFLLRRNLNFKTRAFFVYFSMTSNLNVILNLISQFQEIALYPFHKQFKQ